MVDYSLVIPVYNEEESLEVLFGELTSALGNLPGAYEIIFVNDCSSDDTPQKLDKLRKVFPEGVFVVDLDKKSGQTVALKKGIDKARGELVITLDADLQNDPNDIPKLIDKVKQGFDVVCGWRKNRKDPYLKKILSKLGNVLQRLFTGMKIHDISCTLRAYKRDCVADLKLTWEGQHRFIPLMLAKKGYKVSEVVSNHRDRKFGKSKYNHKRIFKVVIDFFRILFYRA